LIGTALVTNLPSTTAAPRSMGGSPGLPATSAVGRLSADSADDGE
jgi:hypothetical protein